MFEAAGAVPCWIMSHARVSEAMPADVGAFDLVIVDEASQSDLWALPAILRGKKILVVGDDKQVSPDAGFIDSQRIEDLKNRFLTEQPFGTEMTPEKSLYELAARVFAAQQVMLREHFRCVPPIIALSEPRVLQGRHSPLRIPKPSERLDPPLVDIFVNGGVRDRRNCNEAEANVIAAEIKDAVCGYAVRTTDDRCGIAAWFRTGQADRRSRLVAIATLPSFCGTLSNAATRVRFKVANATSCSCLWWPTQSIAKPYREICLISASTLPLRGRRRMRSAGPLGPGV